MKATILLALTLAGLPAARALDLTPADSYRLLEGVKIPVISFEDGQRKVNWQPPDGWQLSGGGMQLYLYPPDAQLASMQLKLLAHASAQAPDATAARDGLLKWVASLLPGDATGVTFDHEAPSPFFLGGKPSRELTFNYVSVAHKCSTSIALVDLDERQSLAVVITARAEDFKALHSDGTKSMFRWNWVAKSIAGPEAASNEDTPKAVTASSKPAAR